MSEPGIDNITGSDHEHGDELIVVFSSTGEERQEYQQKVQQQQQEQQQQYTHDEDHGDEVEDDAPGTNFYQRSERTDKGVSGDDKTNKIQYPVPRALPVGAFDVSGRAGMKLGEGKAKRGASACRSSSDQLLSKHSGVISIASGVFTRRGLRKKNLEMNKSTASESDEGIPSRESVRNTKHTLRNPRRVQEENLGQLTGAISSTNSNSLNPNTLETYGEEDIVVAAQSQEERTAGLVVARQVTSQRDLQRAEQLVHKDTREQDSHLNDRQKLIAALVVVAGLAALIGVIILIVSLVRNHSNEDPVMKQELEDGSNLETRPPPFLTLQEWSLDDRFLSMLPLYTQKDIHDNLDSPQAQAYQWLFNDTYTGNYSDTRMVQRFALATFYYATHGDYWPTKTNTDWLSYDRHECDWHFRTEFDPNVLADYGPGEWSALIPTSPCSLSDDTQERVYSYISMANNARNFQIPPEFFLLTHLQGIALSLNELTGSIATEIGCLTRLWAMALGSNELSGTIPSEIAAATDLFVVHLSANKLTGTIPTELGSLTNLGHLGMMQNQLIGPLPSEFGLLTRLDTFWAFDNQLSGSIPSELGRLPLEGLFWGELQLQNNQFSGQIPTELGLIRGLHRLDLSSNTLTGTIPSELGALVKTPWISLDDNDLSGTLPSEVCWLRDSWYNGVLRGCLNITCMDVDCFRVDCSPCY